ncbi:MAG: hypothetical protein PHO89_01300 [Methylacidiphilaceae bacterium]|nr:hypothetical protein [Candidatus Methylacidiphilaceae bacterium]
MEYSLVVEVGLEIFLVAIIASVWRERRVTPPQLRDDAELAVLMVGAWYFGASLLARLWDLMLVR